MFRQPLSRIFPRGYLDTSKHLRKLSATAASEETTSSPSETVKAEKYGEHKRETKFLNNVTIDGIIEDKCDYLKDEDDRITAVTFMLKHQPFSHDSTRLLVRTFRPGLMLFLLNKTYAGSEVKVKGQLVSKKNDPGRIHIRAVDVRLKHSVENDTE